MSGAPPLRAAVIGLGVGARHAAALARLPGVELAALCDRDPEVLHRVGEKLPGVRQVARSSEVLEDPSIDVVVIASYDDAHCDETCAALRNGKHVFVEKPLCRTPEEATRILQAMRERPDLKISSNLILRRCPRFVALRERIRSGDLGAVYYLDGDYNYGRVHKITQGWRGRIPGYSVFLGGGLHLVDLMQWLLSDRVASVQAIGSDRATRGTDFSGPDTVVALLTFRSGVIAKISANFACVYPHFHRLSVYGTKATFENDVTGGRIFRERDGRTPPEVLDAAYPGMDKGDLLPDFLEAVRSGREPEVNREELFHGLAVGFAVERSLREGGLIPIERIAKGGLPLP